MIYLDNAATTKMNETLLDVIKDFSCERFYNASAGYSFALSNSKSLNEARETILKKLGANKGDVIFTGSATEANNLAIKGSIREGKWQYIFSIGEHPSVYNVAKEMQESGREVKFISLQKNGQVDYIELEEFVNEKTRFVSIMLVNNETGSLNDIAKISKIVKSKNPAAIIHVDAVQGFCKIPFSLQKWDIDLLSISAHKFHGPKGVAALYVKNKNSLKSIMAGGGQEFGLRSGTENLPAIMAMSKCCQGVDVEKNYEKVLNLRSVFLSNIDLKRVSYVKTESPYICSLSFEGVNGETLMRALENEVVIGTGSACSTKKSGNRVLEAMGFDAKYIKSSVRVSFNAYQTEEEVRKAANIIMKTYEELYERLK